MRIGGGQPVPPGERRAERGARRGEVGRPSQAWRRGV